MLLVLQEFQKSPRMAPPLVHGMLYKLAQIYRDSPLAITVVKAVEKRLSEVAQEDKSKVIVLIDSIIKNIGGSLPSLFSLDHLFDHVLDARMESKCPSSECDVPTRPVLVAEPAPPIESVPCSSNEDVDLTRHFHSDNNDAVAPDCGFKAVGSMFGNRQRKNNRAAEKQKTPCDPTRLVLVTDPALPLEFFPCSSIEDGDFPSDNIEDGLGPTCPVLVTDPDPPLEVVPGPSIEDDDGPSNNIEAGPPIRSKRSFKSERNRARNNNRASKKRKKLAALAALSDQ